MYLCERDAGMLPKRTFDIFFHISRPSNRQLELMWRRVIRISQFARYVDLVNRWIPGGKKHVFELLSPRDTRGLLTQTPVHLFFTVEEEAMGRKALLDLGILENAPIVCFTARDSAYLEAEFAHVNWEYHNFRNSNIQDYLQSVSELTDRGYYAIRTGAIVKGPISHINPKIIDYATQGRTPFLDIFLSAKCKMFLSSGSGIDSVARIFRKPVAYVNFIPIEYVPTWGPDDLFIPKKLKVTKEDRLMTFPEIFHSGVGRFLHAEQYQQTGIEVIDNSPQEITDLALEMDDRLMAVGKQTKRTNYFRKSFGLTSQQVN